LNLLDILKQKFSRISLIKAVAFEQEDIILLFQIFKMNFVIFVAYIQHIRFAHACVVGGMTPQGIAGLVMGIVLLLGIAGAIGGFLYVRRRNQMLYGKMADEQPIHYDNPVYSEGVFGSGIKDLHSAPASSGAGNLGN
jgi:hypothetical protein